MFLLQSKPDPKAVLRLDDINITLVPHKMQNPNGMQIMFEHDGHTRNIFVYAQSGQVRHSTFSLLMASCQGGF